MQCYGTMPRESKHMTPCVARGLPKIFFLLYKFSETFAQYVLIISSLEPAFSTPPIPLPTAKWPQFPGQFGLPARNKALAATFSANGRAAGHVGHIRRLIQIFDVVIKRY